MGWNPPSGPPHSSSPPPSPAAAAAAVVDAATQAAGTIADAASNAGDSAAAAGESAAGTATAVLVEVVDAIGAVLDHVAEEGRAVHREGGRVRTAAEAAGQSVIDEMRSAGFWKWSVVVSVLVVIVVLIVVMASGGIAGTVIFLLVFPLLRDALRHAVNGSGSPEGDGSGSVERFRRVQQLVIDEIRRGRHMDAPPGANPTASFEPVRVLVRGLPAQLSGSKGPGRPSPATLVAVGERLERLGRVVAVVAGTALRRRVDPRMAGALWKLHGRLSTTAAVLAETRTAVQGVRPLAPRMRRM